jgi:hypothetical protein
MSKSRISLFFQSLASNGRACRAEAFAPELRYDLALSLGQACVTRFQIDRIQRERHFHHYRPVSGFFDSLARDKGHQCMVELVASNFELNAEDFELKKDDSGHWRAYVPRLGLFFIHDFKFSTEDSEQCWIELKKQAPVALGKYRYLGDKFINILRGDRRILLVLTDSSQISADIVDDLVHAIRNVNRNADFSILQVAFADVGVKIVDHPDVIGISMDNSAAKDWTGVHAGYDEAFRNIFIRATLDGGK